jgi:cytoskeletal protein RodZ
VSEPIGGYLARQRQLRGISIGELAEATRIPRRSLERLEAGAFDSRPDGFVRGFVRTVAEALGLEPDDTVNRMRTEPEAQGETSRAASRLQLSLAFLATALLLVLPLVWINQVRLSSPGSAEARAPESDRVVRRDAVKALIESLARPPESPPVP